MAVSYSCDGCGVAVEIPARVGKITQREYCEDCGLKAQAFVDAEEALRLEVQQAFVKKREALIAKHGKSGFKLPDVA
jgi:hypothetical protein